MNIFKIKVTGEGTKREIVNALAELIESIKNTDETKMGNIEYEDETLCTEINQVE